MSGAAAAAGSGGGEGGGGGGGHALAGVELGALHRALAAECEKGGPMALKHFTAVVRRLNPEAPPAAVQALFEAMDVVGPR